MVPYPFKMHRSRSFSRSKPSMRPWLLQENCKSWRLSQLCGHYPYIGAEGIV